MKKIYSILMGVLFSVIAAVPAFAAGDIADVIAELDLSGIGTALAALFVAAIGIRLLFKGYQLVKSGLGRA